MAAYREHVSISGLLGTGYGFAAWFFFAFTPVQSVLAGVLTWIAGMLPDLDSQSGKPVREVFSLLAAAAPLAMMGRLQRIGGSPEDALLLAIALYAGIRYGGALLLGKLSVHRGMFHSLPALLIAAECTFLAYESPSLSVRLLMAGGVAMGFLSHLVLDELYAVQWTGLRLRLNKFAGSALKLFGPRFVPNVFTYALLGVLTYATLVNLGLLPPPQNSGGQTVRRDATGTSTLRPPPAGDGPLRP